MCNCQMQSSEALLHENIVAFLSCGTRHIIDFISVFVVLCRFLLAIHCTFSMFYRILPYYVFCCCILIRLECDVVTSIFFIPDSRLFKLTPLFLPYFSVSLSYYILAGPMRECLGKHSCMSSPFSIAILNDTYFFTKRDNRNGEVACQKLTVIIIVMSELAYFALL